MSTSERFKDLDPTVAEALEGAVRDLRDEFQQRLDETRRELGLEAAAAAEAAAEAAPAAEPPGLPEIPALDPLEELRHAVRRIDRAGSQVGILTALLEGTDRFASRAALFLTRPEGLRCWGSVGFEEAGKSPRDLDLTPPGESPWKQALSGGGAFPLDPGDCATLCDRIDAEAPRMGLLAPFQLGDRVVAVLYCDRMADDDPLNISALQLLTFNAGQVLETLPVRKRKETGVLRLAGVEAAAAVAEPVVEAVPEPVEEAVPEPVEEVVPEPVEEAVPEPVEEAAPEPVVEAVPEPVEEAVPEPVEEVVPEPAVEAVPELVEEAVPEPVEEAAPELVEEAAPELAEAPALEEPSLEAPPLEAPPIEAEEPAAPEPAEKTAPLPVEEPAAPPEAPFEAAPPVPPVTPRSGTEVVPPEDVKGPGWAFSTAPIPEKAGDEGLHEEARRLARLLVTEIKLYNEEQVEAGRRAGDLYARLKEDIDRSRQIFDERVDPRVREQNDYFKDALVRILAGGDESSLGM